MNKLFTKIAGLVLGLTMAVGVGVASITSGNNPVEANAAGETATLSFANKAQRTSFSTSKQVWEQNGITFTNDKASSSNTIADYANPVRLYANSSITVAYGKKMTKIVFNCNSTTYATALKNSIGSSVTVSSKQVTVTLSEASESFNVAKLSAQIRLDSLTVTYTETTISLSEITKLNGGLSAVVGDEEWNVSELKVLGKLSNSDDEVDVTTYVNFIIDPTTPSSLGVGTHEVDVTVKAKEGEVLKNFSIDATINLDPFEELIKITDINAVSANSIYALSNSGVKWGGNSISSNDGIVATNKYEELGYFKLIPVPADTGYKLKFVTLNANTGIWEEGLFINNGSGTDMSSSSSTTDSTVFTVEEHKVNNQTVGLYLINPSNSNRFLGFNSAETDATLIKAYASGNFGSSSYPVAFLYEVPQDKLTGITVSGQKSIFTAGDKFSVGGTVTATYSKSGDTTVLTGGSFNYTINGVAVTTDTILNYDSHNGQSVIVSYTDEAGTTVSATPYTITVNYKDAIGISIDRTSAQLSIGASVTLTATVSDEYANSEDVSWSVSDENVVEISNSNGRTVEITALAGGTVNVIAKTSNGLTASCAVMVFSEPLLTLKDINGNDVNDQTINCYTGDELFYLTAISENVVSPTYVWECTNEGVVEITYEDEICQVEILGAGIANVTITVGELSRTVTFNVTASAVTTFTLTSSVEGGQLFDGDYLNTLTLTPSLETVGNATKVVNWSSSNLDVATVSTPTTTNEAITVTAVGNGSAVITATSAYTPSIFVTYEINVTADGVTQLSWTNRPDFEGEKNKIFAGETTLGDLITNNAKGIGVFTPTWVSGMSDTPTFGVGENDVHILLYETGTPSEEGQPLTTDYVFSKEDNGKSVVAIYRGITSTSTKLNVTNWRNVIEETTSYSTIEWASETASIEGDLSASLTLKKNYYYEKSSMRLGTNKGGGEMIINSPVSAITSITITAKAYSDARTGQLTVGTDVIEITNTDYKSFDITLSTPTKELKISTPNDDVRININSIQIYSESVQDIGKTEDCLGLEVFINEFLHMDDYTEELGWCADEEHNYYKKAKEAYNKLNDNQRNLFVTNSAYINEYTRLSKWAVANGETIITNGNGQSSIVPFDTPLSVLNESFDLTIVVIVASMTLVAAGVIFIKKRKENQ